jgi:hypothetical protein
LFLPALLKGCRGALERLSIMLFCLIMQVAHIEYQELSWSLICTL